MNNKTKTQPTCSDCRHLNVTLWICRAASVKCYTKPGRVACLLYEVKKDA